MSEGDALNWGALVAHSVHPTRLWIIEAMLRIERPLSATELEGVFGKKKKALSSISYHMMVLVKFGIVEEASERPVRGATEHFYYFTKAVLK
jgi:DNA-binding transcriptional ArsR family regulator